ncbi:MAG TPA: HDOD domain-containing protein [Fimbriimonas sp.]|nr:HDOD domain-containing protein [Fimbriimonas sp.]
MVKTAPLATAQFIQRSIEKSLRELPALPDAVMRVVEETNKAEPSVAKIEKYVSTDQALASKVLRVVNSAYYGLSGQVSSLGQSVMILGIQQVRNLVLSVGAISLFEVKGPQQQETLRRFWLHSFSSAIATQAIGKTRKFDRGAMDQMFVGGLLHDVGRLFLFANFTAAYDQLIRRAMANNMPVELAEWSLLGIGHAEVGQRMADFWKLPEALGEIIGKHEGPFDGSESPVIYCVHVADAISKHVYYNGDSKVALQIDPVAEEWLNLTAEEFDELREEVAAKTEEASGMFKQLAA